MRGWGQGLVEFAIILPVLLLILFGIIEFARLLQAWLAVENASRFAVRYAVTGSFDPQFCDEATAYYLTHDIPGLSPAATLGAGDDTYDADGAGPAPADPANDCSIPQGVPDFQVKTEALTDWARLASIQNVSRNGAPGTLIQDNVSGDYLQYLSNTATQFYTPGYQTYRGNPSAAGFFNVTICSNRQTPPVGVDPNPYYYNQVASDENQYPQPCVTGSNYFDDAGGPGDRVRVSITFRHPMILPLISSVWPSLRLEAHREGIVEQFRTSRNIVLPAGIGVLATWTNTPTITPTPSKTATSTPSDTPTKTLTPSQTPTKTLTPTPTPSSTKTLTTTPSKTATATATANCAQFSISAFTQTNTGGGSPKPRLSINVTNSSAQDTDLQSLTFTWTAYDSANPGETVDRIAHPNTGTTLNGTDDFSSPTAWTNPGGLGTTDDLNAGQTNVLSFDFKYADAAWPGIVAANTFGLTLTLGNNCTLTLGAVPTATSTITPTASKTPTRTITPTPSQTLTPSNTPTRTMTPTITQTPTITNTPTKTNTPTITPTPSRTSTRTITPTPSNTLVSTLTFTPTPSATRTATRTSTPTPTNTVGPSPTNTQPSPTPSKTPTVFVCPYSLDNPNFYLCKQTPPPAVWP